MPRTPVDYSKTVIYKIQHVENESLVYVGSTTNFTKRKACHKTCCNNLNSKAYNCKVYDMIRNNGGWEMFKMVEIEKFPCRDKREAEAREDELMIELKANMNDRRAHRTKQQYIMDTKEAKKKT